MADTIRETIRTTRVYASPSLKSEYGPELWADKRKQAFGRVRLVNDSSAMPIDSFHAELCEMDPASFDDGLICLSDMLDEMIGYMARTTKDDSDAAEFSYRLDRMTAERDALRKEVEELRQDNAAWQNELNLQAKLISRATDKIEQLKSQLSDAPTASKPAADKFTAIRNQFASVPGVKIEIHGEQSSDPILWIFGTTKAMQSQLTAAGLRWAPKKSGWYTRA